MIPYGRQQIEESDINAVVEVLRSDFLTQGAIVPAFEQALARYCESRFAIAVSHGTAALHLACLALDLEPGDWLWTSAITFVASANCGLYCGASIDLVDIDPQTRNMSIDALAEKLEKAEQRGTLPTIVVPVHFGGLSCDMERISELARRYGFRILEDASHALGGRYRGEPIGNCRYSDATVFSFHPVKNITTGEGGAVVTNNSEVADRVARLRTHGITRDAQKMAEKSHGPWHYEQIETGFNYRMTDVQAALGLSQLKRLDGFIELRRTLADRYTDLLSDWQLQLPKEPEGFKSAWHLYPVELAVNDRWTVRRRVFDELRERGWGVNVHYIPLYYHPDLSRRLPEGIVFRAAENYYAGTITLPLFPALSRELQDDFIEDLDATMQAHCVETGDQP